MDLENKKVYIDGKEYELITYLQLEDGDFVVYTDNEETESGVKLYINSVEINEDEYIFGEVDDEDFNKVLLSLQERMSE
jgi:hypothetical protein